MSDTPQGPGWWQASDDKWYPPPRPQMPGEEAAPPTAAAPTMTAPYGAPGSGGYPAGPPTAVSGGFVPPGAPGAPGPGVPGGPPGAPGTPGGPPILPGAQPSPYGVPPVPPGQGGQQNRTPLFIVLGVVVAAALVGLILMLTSGDDEEPTATGSSTTAAPDTTVAPATTAAPGPETTAPTPATTGGGEASGEISVTESGFSVYTDQLSEEQRLSYGFVLQNNSDQVATSLPVTVAFLDDAGTVVGSADENIGVLLPGQAMGIGDELYELAGAAATMQVTAGEPSSWEAPGGDYGEITVDGISTTIDEYGAPTSNFTATSTYAEQIDSPYAYAVYRNAAGEIVGGSYGFLNFLPASGATAGEVTSYSSIPDVDSSKTEVYIDPGYIF